MGHTTLHMGSRCGLGRVSFGVRSRLVREAPLGGAAADASSAASSTFCAKDTAAFFPVSFVALPLCSLRFCQIPSDEVAALSRSCPTGVAQLDRSQISARVTKNTKKACNFLR